MNTSKLTAAFPFSSEVQFLTSIATLSLSLYLSLCVFLLNFAPMETRVSLSVVVVCVALAATLRWVWRMANWAWLKPKKLDRNLRKQGLTGKPYRILFGDLKEETKMREEAKSKPINFSNDILARVLPLHHQMLKTHGKNFFMWVGPKPRVNITDPDQIKAIFSNVNEFEKQDPHPQVVLLAPGLISYGGAKWAKHRKIINPAFHSEKLKIMLPAFHQSCSDMISEWEKLIFAQDKGCELDVWPSVQVLSRDALSRTAFGSSYKEGERIFDLQSELAGLITLALQAGYIPGWRFLPTKLNKRIKEINREIDNLLIGLVKRREKAMKAGETTGDDLLSILIESNSKEIKQHGDDASLGMSIQDVIDECKLFYLAGQATTSTLVVWAIILLSVHQEWQDKARAEVMQVFGHNELDFDGLGRLKTVTMILYEVLRLYPPAPMLTRKVDKETRLGSISLPPGVLVSIPILIVHRDQELWGDDAKDFNPERFSEGIFKATKGQTIFFPFGSGPRICIGQNFAMIEAKMAVSMILQRFSFELSPTYAHSPCVVVVTLKPQHGAHIILKKL